MKKQLLFFAALCMTMGIAMTSCKKNDSVIDQKDDDQKESSTGANGHYYVDLGLPSGLKWATCNVGATKENEPGDFYAWGETETKETFTWDNLKYCEGEGVFTKYNGTDGKTVLDADDDAVHKSMGGGWRMPTKEDWAELLENCEVTSATIRGTYGYVLTAKNVNSIFMPAAGWKEGDVQKGEKYASYWSSSNGESTGTAFGMDITDGMEQDVKRLGMLLRGVIKAEGNNPQPNTSIHNGHVLVDLGLSVKWATCNVGATNAWDYGDYFAWGETVGYGKSDPSNAHNIAYTEGSDIKTYYHWDTYKYCSGTSGYTLTKYNTDSDYGTVDNKKTLELTDDAARVNMGGSWRMPTITEQQELLNNCYWEWTTNYNSKGVKGYIVYKVKSDSDKGKMKTSGSSSTTIVGSYSLTDVHIFLPAAGYRYESDLNDAGNYGYYWSLSLVESSPERAYFLCFHSGKVYWGGNSRYCGRSVRGVVE